MTMAAAAAAASSCRLLRARVLGCCDAAAMMPPPPSLQLRDYHRRVIDHYENPRNVGSIDQRRGPSPDTDIVVGTGIVGAPACGDVMKLQVAVDERTGIIRDARFKTFGCGSAIASSSLATEWIKGRPLEHAERVRNADIAKHLCLPPVKLHCSMLAQDAIAQSVRDARAKQTEQRKQRS